MLNVIALMGRLVADPELRHTPNGIATCTFRIAVDRNFVRAGEERKGGIGADAQRDQRQRPQPSRGQQADGRRQHRAHERSGQRGLEQNAFQVQLHAGVLAHIPQVGQHADGVAGERGDGRAVDVDAGHADQRVVEQHLDGHARHERIHGNALLAQAL